MSWSGISAHLHPHPTAPLMAIPPPTSLFLYTYPAVPPTRHGWKHCIFSSFIRVRLLRAYSLEPHHRPAIYHSNIRITVILPCTVTKRYVTTAAIQRPAYRAAKSALFKIEQSSMYPDNQTTRLPREELHVVVLLQHEILSIVPQSIN
jgi:hypothetical protein